MSDLSNEQIKGLFQWWNGLEDNRADRAHLRHAVRPDEIVSSNVFGRFAKKVMVPDDPGARLRYATVAGLLARVHEHDSSKCLSKQMASESTTGRERAVSESRFQRLLRTYGPDCLFEHLRRVLSLLGPRPATNIFDLTADVLNWGPQVRQKWADAYYAEFFSRESAPEEALKPFRAKWNNETNTSRKTLDLCEVWWRTLDDRRAERAALRRCASTAEVHLTPGYHRLNAWLRTDGLEWPDPKRLATTAGLLAHVNTNIETSFPQRLAGLPEEAKKKDRERRATLSGLRFRRLLAIEDDAERYRALIRSLRLIDGRLNVRRFANDLLYWKAEGPESTLHSWAEAYYTASPAAI